MGKFSHEDKKAQKKEGSCRVEIQILATDPHGGTQTIRCNPLRGKDIGTRMNTDYTDEKVFGRFAVKKNQKLWKRHFTGNCPQTRDI